MAGTGKGKNYRHLVREEIRREARGRAVTAPSTPARPRSVGGVAPGVPGQSSFNPNDVLSLVQPGRHLFGASATGTDAYEITLSPAIADYTDGLQVSFRVDVDNDGACTLEVNDLGPEPILDRFGDVLEAGDIEADQVVEVRWNETLMGWQMLNLARSTGSSSGADVVGRRRGWLGL